MVALGWVSVGMYCTAFTYRYNVASSQTMRIIQLHCRCGIGTFKLRSVRVAGASQVGNDTVVCSNNGSMFKCCSRGFGVLQCVPAYSTVQYILRLGDAGADFEITSEDPATLDAAIHTSHVPVIKHRSTCIIIIIRLHDSTNYLDSAEEHRPVQRSSPTTFFGPYDQIFYTVAVAVHYAPSPLPWPPAHAIICSALTVPLNRPPHLCHSGM
jgi:hypothetical protein